MIADSDGESSLAVYFGVWAGVGGPAAYFLCRRQKRRDEGDRLRWAPDRIELQETRILACFDQRPGPGRASHACIPFGEIVRFRTRWGVPIVKTGWWVWRPVWANVEKFWHDPPIASQDPTGLIPGAISMHLTPQSGNLLADAWARFRGDLYERA